jgi:CubicO group peptidase (beta-lactamase class C family)
MKQPITARPKLSFFGYCFTAILIYVAFSSWDWTPDAATRLDRLMEVYGKQLRSWNVPGLTATILVPTKHGRREILFKHWGTLGLNSSTLVDQDSLFHIGSNTKLMTAMVIGKALEEKNLTWSTRLADIGVPLHFLDPYVQKHITFVDLLTHRTGMPRNDVLIFQNRSLSDAVQKAQQAQASFEFRTGYEYNNHMFALSGIALNYLYGIHEVSFSQYVKLIQEYLFDPLGMTGALLDWNQIVTHPKYAYSHNVDFGVGVVQLPRQVEKPFMDMTVSAGGVALTSKDYARFLEHLLSAFKESTGSFSETFQMIFTTHNPTGIFKSLTGYGLGIGITEYRGKLLFTHNGGLLGQQSNMCVFPNDDFAIAYQINADSCPITCFDFADQLLFKDDISTSGSHLQHHTEKALHEAQELRLLNEKMKKERKQNTQPTLTKNELLGFFDCDVYTRIELIQVQSEPFTIKISLVNATVDLLPTMVHWEDDSFATLNLKGEPTPGSGLFSVTKEENRIIWKGNSLIGPITCIKSIHQ